MTASIGKHIRKVFLSLSAFSLLVCITFTMGYLWRINKLHSSGQNEILNIAGVEIKRNLSEHIRENTEALIIGKTQSLDQSLSALAETVLPVARFVEYLNTPEGQKFPTQRIPLPNEITDSNHHVHLLAGALPDSVNYPDSIGRYANLVPIFESAFKRYPNLISIYFTSDDYGYSVDYDAYAHLKSNNHDLRQRDWYRATVEHQKLTFCKPYCDLYGHGYVISIAIPCYDADSRILGVVAADFAEGEFYNTVVQNHMTHNGHGMIISDSGEILIGQEENIITFSPDLMQLILDSPSGTTEVPLDSQTLLLCWKKLQNVDWTFLIAIPQTDIYQNFYTNHNKILDEIQHIQADQRASLRSVEIRLFVISAFVILLALVASTFISRKISRPLRKLTFDVQQLGKGKWNYKSDILTRDEIEALSHAFEFMTAKISGSIKALIDVTTLQRRIESELQVAQKIQQDILPPIRPPFPQCDYFALDAQLISENNVGGNLYDFFMLNESKLCLAIGDVAGESVPGALFMAVTQTLHRGLSTSPGITPSQLVTKMNDSLCKNNSAGMSITYIFAEIDLTTGEMLYCNAGHPPFCVLKSNGAVESPKESHGLPLGRDATNEYQEGRITLAPGDTLFFYTRGIPEAQNKLHKHYGMERFKNFITKEVSCKDSPATINQKLMQDLQQFTANAEQTDDMTLLTISFLKLKIAQNKKDTTL